MHTLEDPNPNPNEETQSNQRKTSPNRLHRLKQQAKARQLSQNTIDISPRKAATSTRQQLYNCTPTTQELTNLQRRVHRRLPVLGVHPQNFTPGPTRG